MKLSHRTVVITLVSALAVVGLLAGAVLASVTLSSFDVYTIDNEAYVSVEWETATELNTSGFFVSRSTNPTSGFVRQNDTIIPAMGDGVTGWFYDFQDENVVIGTTYYYQLEVVNNDQSTDYFGPVAIVVGIGTPTPTTTRTSTPTSTPGSAPASTFTFTPTPSRTPTRAATFTPTATNTPAPTAAPSQPTSTPTSIAGPSGFTITPAAPLAPATATPAVVNQATAVPPRSNLPTTAPTEVASVQLPNESDVNPLPTPQSIAAAPSDTGASGDTQAPPAALSGGQAPIVQVPMAPLVIATPERADQTAPAQSRPPLPALLILMAAVALLVGGLYSILRTTSKSS